MTAELSPKRSDPTTQVFDGFISYSHSADDLLAPRLQAGLQQFAKPWWKRRAVRIFRDESSLAANPHLWSSITEALDASGWFVLLLSPDAAESEWVGKEIDHWRANQPADRILPVVTDGEFGWSDGDVAGSSVPLALHGAFSEEPRWVDLRFARGEETLDLKNPAFAAAIADVASSIRGVPKDELASEEVRQHRRTVRIAWTAGSLVVGLAVVSVLFGVSATSERNRADDAAAFATEQAARADANAEAAVANAEEAEIQRAAAERQAAMSRSRELSASAIAVLDEDPELSIMLAVESVNATPDGATPSPEAVRTLRQAVLANRLVARFEGLGDYARISPDGLTIYHADAGANRVVALDAESGRERWGSEAIADGLLGRVEISPDGGTVTAQVHYPDDLGLLVFDASSGEVRVTLTPGEGCTGIDVYGFSTVGGFSPGGEWFTIYTGTSRCGLAPGEGWVAAYDTVTWEEQYRLNTDDGFAFAAEFSADGSRVVISSLDETAELRTFPALEPIRTYDEAWTFVALSPDGQRIAYLDGGRGPVLADAETGELLSSLSHAAEAFFFTEPFVFSPDGAKLLVGARGRDLIFDGSNGQYLGVVGANGPTVSGSFTEDGSRMLTSTLGTGLVWGFGTGEPIANEFFAGDWINPEQAIDGPTIAVNVLDFSGPNVMAVLDADSGQVTSHRTGWGSQLPDGQFVVVPAKHIDGAQLVGPLEVWNSVDGSSIQIGGCVAELDFNEPEADCPVGEHFFGGGAFDDPLTAVAGPPGTVFAVRAQDASDAVVIWDQLTLNQLSEFGIDPDETLVGMTDRWIVTRFLKADLDRLTVYDLSGGVVKEIPAVAGRAFAGNVEFDPSGRFMLARDAAGTAFVYETAMWGLVTEWQIRDGFVRGWSLSEDGQRLATAAEDGLVDVWDVSGVVEGTPPIAPVVTIQMDIRPSDVVWVSEDRLMVFIIDLGTGARSFTAFLDTDDLVRDARERLTRGFTDTECQTYQLADCRMTLTEIRGG